MARVIFNGTPGDAWTNDTGKVQFQFLVSWLRSCGICIQYDHAIGPYWGIPMHRHCRCKQTPIAPGATAEPFVDFRALIGALDPRQQVMVVGKANLILINKNIVTWEDVVTRSRIRDLREVVSMRKLTLPELTGAGVSRGVAERAYATVHTPAHELAEATRKELVAKLRGAGETPEQIKRKVGEGLAARVKVAAIPPPPALPAAPPPAPAPKPRPRPAPRPAPAPGPLDYRDLPVTFTPSQSAKNQSMRTLVIDVARLSEAWEKDARFFVPPGAEAKPGTRAGVEEFLAKAERLGIPVEQSKVTLDVNGDVGFLDGRHRFSVLRDRGVFNLPVSVYRTDYSRLAKAFGWIDEKVRRVLGIKPPERRAP
jgi:hypothetical protein